VACKQGFKLSFDRRHLPLIVTGVLLVAMYVSGMIFYEAFRSLRFFVDLIKGNAALGICAVGMTFVILSGGIDLSVGSVLAATTAIIAQLILAGIDPWLAFMAGTMFGAASGVVSGLLIHELVLPPFLVTLAGLFFIRGLAFLVTREPLSLSHPTLDWIMDELGLTLVVPGWGTSYLPPTGVLFLLVLLAGVIVARFTPFGRNSYAIGGDRQAAILMGVPIGATTIALYALSGFCAGLGGAATTLIDSAGKPNIGVGLELEAIGAVVIGGTMLSGGIGTVAGTLMGVMIIGLVRAVINIDGRLSSPWHHITIGLLLLMFIALQQLLTRPNKATMT
jgi:simple sugar transport system permease protein